MNLGQRVGWIEQRPGHQLFITIPESYSDEEFIREFDELSQLLSTAEHPLGVLIVIKMKTRSRPSNRERAKRFFVEEKKMLRTQVRACALVSDHLAIRGAISAARLLGLFPFATKTFDDVVVAQSWLTQKIAR